MSSRNVGAENFQKYCTFSNKQKTVCRTGHENRHQFKQFYISQFMFKTL